LTQTCHKGEHPTHAVAIREMGLGNRAQGQGQIEKVVAPVSGLAALPAPQAYALAKLRLPF